MVDRMVATLHQQRATEARRVLQRYRHLLETQDEALPLNEVDFGCSEEEPSENAHQSDARERGADHRHLERA
ncbi:hypothetical protein ACTGJ9_028310 [Bradyrhizobium sp. RDM12]